MQICIFITCKCFPYSVPGSGKKRKRKKIEQEEEADYEKRPRTIQTEQGRNERVLLPIKSKDSIIPRTEKIPIVGVYMYLFAWIQVSICLVVQLIILACFMNFVFLSLKVIIILHYHTQKQRKMI